MKKAAIALILSLTLSGGMLTACGNGKSGEEFGSASQAESSAEIQAPREFERGTVSGDVFTSAYAGISLTAPAGWRFYSEKELMKLMNLSLELLGTEDLNKSLLELTVVYDAMVLDESTGNNVIIGYENLALEVPDPDDYTVTDYISALDGQFALDLTTAHTKTAEEDIELGGSTYRKVVYSIQRDTSSFQQYYYLRKIGNFIHMIIMTPRDPELVPVLEKQFSGL